uniref:Amidase n=1 Tax=mine drainage metagenome TaxID=410659 RepID=E6PWS6_9ZZZZ
MRRVAAFMVGVLMVSSAGWGQTAQPFDVVGATIAETQAAILSGRTTCRGVVEAYLARIRAYDQTVPASAGLAADQRFPLNAIVTLNPQALAEADACDRDVRRTRKLPPLGGIAMLVKDNYDTAGLQTTGGSLAMKGFVPARDAAMVARLRAAGAIVLAKTNMAEWAFSPYLTASSIAGITRNAYDLSRVPAGSSGGTAAGVAASLGAVGLGTDTGNSIRGPSSHNALVGIRPTIGLTSRTGIIPLFTHNDVGGPMARTVADAAAVLTVVAGPDATDADLASAAEAYPHAWNVDYTQYLDRHGLRGARIGVFRQYIDRKTADPEVKAAMERALATLKSEGATLVDPFTIPDFEEMEKDLWCGDFEGDLNRYLDAHPNAPYHSLKEIVASGLYLPYIDGEMKGAIAPPERADRRSRCEDVYHDASKVKFRDALVKAMAAAHVDAMVYPTWSNPPRKVGDMSSPAGDNSQVLSPQTGFPAITVPMGYTHGDLPAGMTILAPAFREDLLIRYAYNFEMATHWRREPELFPTLSGAGFRAGSKSR